MLGSVLVWGLVAGLIHFAAVGALYGNPLVDRIYQDAQRTQPSVRRWASRPAYLITQFAGTQVEVFLLSIAFFWVRPLLGPGYGATTLLAALLTGIRIYPRFWNMWIQSTYPRKLLAIEVINGTVSTFVVLFSLEFLA